MMVTRADTELSMPLVWVLPSEPASAALLRRGLRGLLALLPQQLLDDLLLVASELVTNAIVHGDGTVAVTIWPSPAVLRLDITDSGRAAPQVRQDLHEEDEKGRGLRIVDALATRWGVTPTPHGPGKTVWVEMGQAPHLAAP